LIPINSSLARKPRLSSIFPYYVLDRHGPRLSDRRPLPLSDLFPPSPVLEPSHARHPQNRTVVERPIAVRLEFGDPRSKSTSGPVSVWTDGPGGLVEGRQCATRCVSGSRKGRSILSAHGDNGYTIRSSQVDISVINRFRLGQRAYPAATLSDYRTKFCVLQTPENKLGHHLPKSTPAPPSSVAWDRYTTAMLC